MNLDRLLFHLFYRKSQKEVYEWLEEKFEQNDPWKFEKSKFEEIRFQKQIELIKTVPHKTILEIGCAEGHFTKRLTEISENVVAIDLSGKAIKRARQKAPRAKYIQTTIEKMSVPQDKFDLVVCSEVIYYIEQKKEAAQKIKKMGRHILLSHLGLSFLMIEPYFKSIKVLKRKIHFHPRELKLTVITLLKNLD